MSRDSAPAVTIRKLPYMKPEKPSAHTRSHPYASGIGIKSDMAFMRMLDERKKRAERAK